VGGKGRGPVKQYICVMSAFPAYHSKSRRRVLGKKMCSINCILWLGNPEKHEEGWDDHHLLARNKKDTKHLKKGKKKRKDSCVETGGRRAEAPIKPWTGEKRK